MSKGCRKKINGLSTVQECVRIQPACKTQNSRSDWTKHLRSHLVVVSGRLCSSVAVYV
ncbi:hypothetical protein Plhal304r1_c032g0102301 [Plasmopara halstedii]